MNTKHIVCSSILFLSTVLLPTAKADTFLQYSSSSSGTTVTFDGTTLKGTNIPVFISALDPVTGIPTTGTLNFSATAVQGGASDVGGFFFVQQLDNLSFTLLNGSSNILSGTALTGLLDGTSAGLEFTAQNPGDGVAFTSSFYGPRTGLNFQLGINPNQGPDDSSGTFASFDGSANPGSFVGVAAVTPEPSSVALMGTGAMALFAAARRRLAGRS